MTKAPADLGTSGRQLWDDMHAQMTASGAEFDEKDLTLLTMACRQMDDVAAMQATLQADGVIVTGSTGQPVLNRVVTELRNARESVARLLKQIDWPDERQSASDKARHAARSRWGSRPAPNNPSRRLPHRVLPEAK